MTYLIAMAVVGVAGYGAWLYWGEDIKDFLYNLLG